MKNFLILLLLIVFNSDRSFGQNLYFPPNNSTVWETTNPSDLGYCSDQIDTLYDYLAANDSKAFILLKDGKVVLEKYFGTFAQDSVWYWASAGKTLTAFLVGMAQQEGLLSIDDTTAQYLGQGWTNCTTQQEEKITIRHQLTMTSGLDDNVSNPDCTNSNCLNYLSDVGTRWAYHNAPYTLLDAVIENASGQNFNQFYNSRVRNPIGMDGLYLKVGFNNVCFSTPRAMARFGLLLLAEGSWNGTSILSDSVYFEEMTHPSQSLNEAYGYLTWLNGTNGFMLPQSQINFSGSINPDAPSDMYAAMGKNGQVINVIPSQNMVWIRMGNAPSGTGGLIGPIFNNEIWKKINDLVCNPVSVRGVQGKRQVEIFPNPTNDDISVKTEEEIHAIRVVSSLGQLVSVEVKEEKISLMGLPNGFYYVSVLLKNGEMITEKVLKY